MVGTSSVDLMPIAYLIQPTFMDRYHISMFIHNYDKHCKKLGF